MNVRNQLRSIHAALNKVTDRALKLQERLEQRDSEQNDGIASDDLSDLRCAIGDMQEALETIACRADLPV